MVLCSLQESNLSLPPTKMVHRCLPDFEHYMGDFILYPIAVGYAVNRCLYRQGEFIRFFPYRVYYLFLDIIHRLVLRGGCAVILLLRLRCPLNLPRAKFLQSLSRASYSTKMQFITNHIAVFSLSLFASRFSWQPLARSRIVLIFYFLI